MGDLINRALDALAGGRSQLHRERDRREKLQARQRDTYTFEGYQDGFPILRSSSGEVAIGRSITTGAIERGAIVPTFTAGGAVFFTGMPSPRPTPRTEEAIESLRMVVALLAVVPDALIAGNTRYYWKYEDEQPIILSYGIEEGWTVAQFYYSFLSASQIIIQALHTKDASTSSPLYRVRTWLMNGASIEQTWLTPYTQLEAINYQSSLNPYLPYLVRGDGNRGVPYVEDLPPLWVPFVEAGAIASSVFFYPNVNIFSGRIIEVLSKTPGELIDFGAGVGVGRDSSFALTLGIDNYDGKNYQRTIFLSDSDFGVDGWAIEGILPKVQYSGVRGVVV